LVLLRRPVVVIATTVGIAGVLCLSSYVVARLLPRNSPISDRTIGIFGVAITAVAFLIALAQIARIRSAAEAAESASFRTRQIMRGGSLRLILEVLARFPDQWTAYLRAGHDGLRSLATDWLSAYMNASGLVEAYVSTPSARWTAATEDLETAKVAIMDLQGALSHERRLFAPRINIDRLHRQVQDAAFAAIRLQYEIDDLEVGANVIKP
jgi:hypothetical protein